jgi:hypothetical protein
MLCTLYGVDPMSVLMGTDHMLCTLYGVDPMSVFLPVSYFSWFVFFA